MELEKVLATQRTFTPLTQKETAWLIRNLPPGACMVFCPNSGNVMWRSENPEAWDLLMQYRSAEPVDGSYPMEWEDDGRLRSTGDA